jgi:hypothetical protein
LIPITLQAMKMIQRVSRTNQMVKTNLNHEDNKLSPAQEPAGPAAGEDEAVRYRSVHIKAIMNEVLPARMLL